MLRQLLVICVIFYVGVLGTQPSPYYSNQMAGGSTYAGPGYLSSSFAIGYGIGLLQGRFTCDCYDPVRDQARRFCSFLYYELRIENVEACINCVVITDKHQCKKKTGCDYLSSELTEASPVCVPSGCAQLLDFDTEK